jgi:hypothetical protein
MLTCNGLDFASPGDYQTGLAELGGSGRQAQISVDGGAPQTFSFTPTGSSGTAGTMTLPRPLTAGRSTIEFANPPAYAPDVHRIIVLAAPS